MLCFRFCRQTRYGWFSHLPQVETRRTNASNKVSKKMGWSESENGGLRSSKRMAKEVKYGRGSQRAHIKLERYHFLQIFYGKRLCTLQRHYIFRIENEAKCRKDKWWRWIVKCGQRHRDMEAWRECENEMSRKSSLKTTWFFRNESRAWKIITTKKQKKRVRERESEREKKKQTKLFLIKSAFRL